MTAFDVERPAVAAVAGCVEPAEQNVGNLTIEKDFMYYVYY